MKAKPVIRGLISYVPNLLKYLKKLKGKNIYGGTDSARYCYSIWMRHFINISGNYGKMKFNTVAEIGPGDSLGMGLMALLTGSDKYFAFEVSKNINVEKNLEIFDELVRLFLNKEDIPGDDEFPLAEPKLKNYNFPEYLFDDNFENLSNENRISKIRNSIKDEVCDEIEIKYIMPWETEYKTITGKVDLVYTQAVMEHLFHLEKAYRIMHDVLRGGGIISHEIDYSAHETHEKWYGHLNYGKLLWKIIMHGRPYDINRMPHSAHVKSIENAGFYEIKEIKTVEDSEEVIIRNKEISGTFLKEDLKIKNAYITARKK